MKSINKKQIQIIVCTAITLTTILTIATPKTNSRYYASSDFNKQYFTYQANTITLYEGQKNIEMDFDTSKTANVTFSFPNHNVGNDVITDTFKVEPIQVDGYTCEVVSIGGKSGSSITYNENKTPSKIDVKLKCTTKSDTSNSIEVSNVTVALDSVVNTKVSVDIKEDVNGEGEFPYVSYTQSLTASNSTITADKTVIIADSDPNAFEKFINWIVKYAYAYEKNNKEAIIEYLNNNCQNMEDVKSLKGIKIDVNTYSIDTNFIGYVKTDNAYNASENEIVLYFDSDIINSSATFNSIFNEYLSLYLNAGEENLASALKYMSNISAGNYKGANAVYFGKYSLIGLTAGTNYMTLDKTAFLNTIKPVEKEFAISYGSVQYFDIFTDKLAASDYLRDKANKASLSKSILLSPVDVEISSSTETKLKASSKLQNFINNNYQNNDFTTKYFIQNIGDNEYLLIKIVPDTNNQEFKVYLSDLDEAIRLGKNGIFDYKTNEKIYINISREQPNDPNMLYSDFAKATYVISVLNNYLNSNFEYTKAEDYITTSSAWNADGTESRYYYYHFDYEIIDIPSTNALEAEIATKEVATKPKDTEEETEASEEEAEATPIGGNPPTNINDELPLVVLNEAEALEDFRKAAVETGNENVLDYSVIPAVKLNAEAGTDTEVTDKTPEVKEKLEVRSKEEEPTEKVVKDIKENVQEALTTETEKETITE